MALLKREEFLSVPLGHEDVDVPGGAVRVWELTADQQPDAGELPNRDWALTFAASCVGDEAGPFSPPLTMSEYRTRAGWAAAQILRVAFRLNKITKDEVEKLKGNSPGEPAAASPSGSPSP